jgi:integrase
MPGQAKILTADEIKTVFKVLKNDRDRALFALGIYSGLRIGTGIAKLSPGATYSKCL